MSYLSPLDRFDAGSVGPFIGPFGGTGGHFNGGTCCIVCNGLDSKLCLAKSRCINAVVIFPVCIAF